MAGSLTTHWPRSTSSPVDAGEVQSHPLSAGGRRHFAVVHLDAPHPHLAQLRRAPAGRGAAGWRPCPRRSMLPDHRVPVTTVPMPLAARRPGPPACGWRDRTARGGTVAPSRSSVGQQLGQPFAGHAAHQHDGRAGVARGGQELLHVGAGQLDQVAVDHVDLGEGHHPGRDAEQFDDAQVLAGLGHDPVVGGHHQQEQVDAGGAGHHGLDEALVTGDVDHAQMPAAGQRQLGEAQLDADAALLLLFEPVGVAAGEGLDQGGLAVVDVSGGAESEGTEPLGHGSVGGAARRRGPSLAYRRGPRLRAAPGPGEQRRRSRASRSAASIAQATLSATASTSRSSRASTSRWRLSCDTRATTGTGARRNSARASRRSGRPDPRRRPSAVALRRRTGHAHGVRRQLDQRHRAAARAGARLLHLQDEAVGRSAARWPPAGPQPARRSPPGCGSGSAASGISRRARSGS